MSKTKTRTQYRRVVLYYAYQVWEAFLIVAACGFAALFASPSLDWSAAAQLAAWPTSAVVTGAVFAWHWILQTKGLYRSRRLRNPKDGYLQILGATVIITGMLSTAALVLRLDIIDGPFVLLFWTTTAATSMGSRAITQFILRRLRLHNRNLRFLIIVGMGPRGRRLANRLRLQPEVGYRVLGFVDDREAVQSARARDPSLPILGTLDNLRTILAQTPVDAVFVTLPIKSFYDQIHTVLTHCNEQGITAKYLADFFELDHVKKRLDDLGPTTAISLYRGPEQDWRFSFKRLFDVVVSALSLLMLVPLFCVLALAIKLSSPGPVFFLQDRVGLNKRIFKIVKFRTMVSDAEAMMPQLEAANEVNGPAFKIRRDPRVTQVGALLRSYSLDELPQLLNVLKGDMSLVGPRPLPLRDVEGFEEHWQRRRFSIPPGMTCTWQVSGRNDIPFEQWMQMDLDYIDNWSLKGDLIILLRTIPAVLLRTGAY